MKYKYEDINNLEELKDILLKEIEEKANNKNFVKMALSYLQEVLEELSNPNEHIAKCNEIIAEVVEFLCYEGRNYMENIERNEIFVNELPIKNLKQLSYSIFQDEYLIEDENKANECLKYLIDNLDKLRNLIDYMDEGGYFDNQENKTTILRNEIDIYQIGDILNFLETIKIKEVK